MKFSSRNLYGLPHSGTAGHYATEIVLHQPIQWQRARAFQKQVALELGLWVEPQRLEEAFLSHSHIAKLMGPVGMVSIAVFFGLTAVSLPLPVLPRHLVERSNFDLQAVGWMMAAASVSILISRPWAGRLADRRGPQYAVAAGLLAVLLSSVGYCLATVDVRANTAVGLILTAQIFAGLGEGLIVTGGGSWAVALAGPEKSGWAMSWIGLAMFGGLSAGAAIGASLGLRAVAGLMAVAAITGFCVARQAPATGERTTETRIPLMQVINAVWWPGLTLGLATFGLGVVSSFSALLFDRKGWTGGGLAIALFGMGHVSARLLLSRLADRASITRLLIALIVLEGTGLLLLSVAWVPAVAFVGAALAGFGFSMVFPMMAVPLLRRVPENARGMAIGLYDGAFDIAIGAAEVTCGWVAQQWGLPFAFAVASLVAAASAVAAARSMRFVGSREA